MTFEEFAKGFILFDRTFPQLNTPKDTKLMWYKLLEDVSPQVYERGLVHMLKNNPDWYPSSNFAGKVRESIESTSGASYYQEYEQPKQLPMSDADQQEEDNARAKFRAFNNKLVDKTKMEG